MELELVLEKEPERSPRWLPLSYRYWQRSS